MHAFFVKEKRGLWNVTLRGDSRITQVLHLALRAFSIYPRQRHFTDNCRNVEVLLELQQQLLVV